MCDLETSRMGAPYIYDISRLRVKVVGKIVSRIAVESYPCTGLDRRVGLQEVEAARVFRQPAY